MSTEQKDGRTRDRYITLLLYAASVINSTIGTGFIFTNSILSSKNNQDNINRYLILYSLRYPEGGVTVPRDYCHGSIHFWCAMPVTYVTYLQSSHNYPTSVPSYPHLYSTSSQYSLFIRRCSRSATFIIFSKNNWSLLPLCFSLSLESAPFVSS